MQYFIKENSPYSLRPDPKGKWITHSIKTSNPDEYHLKLEDFKRNKRDPSTHSVTIMPSFMINDFFHLNIEYGILGLNYNKPLEHIGLSFNFSYKRWDIAIGMSRSKRNTEEIGEELLLHGEYKVQYLF